MRTELTTEERLILLLLKENWEVAILGDSYYGNTHGKDGLVIAWIRKEDFWNREFRKAVKFEWCDNQS